MRETAKQRQQRVEAERQRLADEWVKHRWEHLFPELGSYDFAREAFKAGHAAGRLQALTEEKP